MSQHRFEYISKRSRRYVIGLYHGETSKHFVLYVNNDIIKIDFGVDETKKYHFIVDDEILIARLDKQDDGTFEYSLDKEEINQKKPRFQWFKNWFNL